MTVIRPHTSCHLVEVVVALKLLLQLHQTPEKNRNRLIKPHCINYVIFGNSKVYVISQGEDYHIIVSETCYMVSIDPPKPSLDLHFTVQWPM